MNSTEIENTNVNQSEYWNNNSFFVCEFMDANFTRQYIAAINTPSTFISWTFCVFGCVGNLLTIIVLWAYTTSTSTLLTALAVSDTVTLLMRSSMPLIYDPNSSGMFSCYVLPIFKAAPSLLISTWILVTVTIERVVSVVKPFEVKTIFSVKKSRICVTLQILIAFCYYGFDSIGLEVVDNKCQYRITVLEYMHQNIKPWMNVIIIAILPGSIICIGNIVIITHLYKMSKLREHMSASRRHDVSITITLVTASCIFCVIMLPNAIYYILGQQLDTERDPVKICQNFKKHIEFAPVGKCLIQLNACLNFYIYVISGSAFRNDVRRIIKAVLCKRQ